MTNWPTFTVAELQDKRILLVEDGNHGEYRPRPGEFVEHGTPFIRATDLAHGNVQFATAGGINDIALKRVRKGIGKPGDLLFSHKGTVGKLARVPMDAPPFVCSPQTTFWRSIDRTRLRPDYLYAFMRSRAFIDQWWARKGETDMADYVSLTAQRQLRVTLPPEDIQRRIAGPMAAIDDLIDNNRRRVELLQKLSQSIYQEWFVRFRYPGGSGIARFDSPLGPIPEGWKVQNLFEIAQVAFGFSFKSNRFGPSGPYPVVRIRDVPGGMTRTFSDEKPPDQYRVANGDVLIGMDGDFHLRQWTGGDAWLNQRVARLRPLGKLTARHLLLAIKNQIEEWNIAITGTTVAHLGKRHLEQIRIPVPSPDVLALTSEIFVAGANLELALVESNRRLEGIQGLLLPRLMTGEIDVSEWGSDFMAEP